MTGNSGWLWAAINVLSLCLVFVLRMALCRGGSAVAGFGKGREDSRVVQSPG